MFILSKWTRSEKCITWSYRIITRDILLFFSLFRHMSMPIMAILKIEMENFVSWIIFINQISMNCKYTHRFRPLSYLISVFYISVSMFEIVKFENDACTTGGNKNGTCFTRSVLIILFPIYCSWFFWNNQIS